MSVKGVVKNYKKLQKQVSDMKAAPQKTLTALTKDVRARAPGWIATEVVKQYGIKKSDILGQKVGTVKVEGQTFEQTRIRYTGRMLTHTHFGMSPSAPKPNRGAYTLKATIVKGQRSTLGKVKKLTKKQTAALGKNLSGQGQKKSDHSPIMLMRANNSPYLPFQRVSKNRNDLKVRKAISLPQMVSSERTQEGIQATLNENIQKRLDHHMKRFMGK